MDNSAFHLTDEQLAQYKEWVDNIVRPLWGVDAAESVSVTVSFTFFSLGRCVEARIGGCTLVLEEA